MQETFKILGFVSDYFEQQDKFVLIVSSLFMAAFIYLNFRYGLEQKICNQAGSPYVNLYGHFFIYLIAFSVPFLFYWIFSGKDYITSAPVLFLVLVAPFIFAFRTAVNLDLPISADPVWNDYWNQIIFNPIRLAGLLVILFLLWISFYREQTFFGMLTKNQDWTPYFLMILIMVVPIMLAATQADFLATYPRLKWQINIPETAHPSWFYSLLYELSYGSGFVFVEIFFRGFLILALVKFVGKDAILPVACFYCAIHFNKPLMECISSFFGGILLGVVVYQTGSIYGGLIVHLGIAWLMELAPFIVKRSA